MLVILGLLGEGNLEGTVVLFLQAVHRSLAHAETVDKPVVVEDIMLLSLLDNHAGRLHGVGRGKFGDNLGIVGSPEHEGVKVTTTLGYVAAHTVLPIRHYILPLTVLEQGIGEEAGIPLHVHAHVVREDAAVENGEEGLLLGLLDKFLGVAALADTLMVVDEYLVVFRVVAALVEVVPVEGVTHLDVDGILLAGNHTVDGTLYLVWYEGRLVLDTDGGTLAHGCLEPLLCVSCLDGDGKDTTLVL